MSKIAAAEQSGAIDHDTALLYELYASLAYPSLPAAYQSSNPAAPEATAILEELESRMADLPADLRAKVTPFFLRPTDPASIWNQRPASTAQAPGSIHLAAFTASIDYEYVDAKSTNIRVWYAVPRGPAEHNLAQLLADEIDRRGMWSKEKTAMLGHEPCTDAKVKHNGGDGRLDVYILYPGTDLDWQGRHGSLIVDHKVVEGATLGDGAVPGCPEASHIILNAAFDFDHIRVAMAHELFHAFQISFKRPLGAPTHGWWSEATATWAEDLIYPTLNSEQLYLPSYWSLKVGGGAEGPIDDTTGTAVYATYLLPFYLVQKSGDASGTVIGQTWAASETLDALHVLGSLPSWADKFKEFALWNWNQGSVAHYLDAKAQIPVAILTQKTLCMDSHAGVGNGRGGTDCLLKVGTINTAVSQEHTTVQYFEGTPDWPLVEKLDFDLSELHGKAGLGIQAILIKNKGDAKVEDWTDLPRKSLCVEDEDLSKVILVVSDSSIREKLAGTVKIDALGKGCSGWRGTMTGTKRWDGGGSTGETTATFTGLWQQAEPDKPPNCYAACFAYLPSGTVQWSLVCHDERTSVDLSGQVAAGALDPEYPVDDPHSVGHQVLFLRPDGADHYSYYGKGNWVPADLARAIQTKGCSDYSGSIAGPPEYFDLEQDTSGTGKMCGDQTWQIDATADTITGSCFYFLSGPNSYEFQWDLKRVGPAPGG